MQVTFVQNFTDIDDKIIRKANEEGSDYLTRSPSAISTSTRRTPRAWVSGRPPCIPRPPRTSDEIIAMISSA